MIHRAVLLSDLQKLLKKLEADLLERSQSTEIPEVGAKLRREFEEAAEAHRTAQTFEEWRSDEITQAAAAWVLSCVFVRFLEDNALIDPPRIAGPGERLQRARDEHELYFRSHPTLNDRDYLIAVFDGLEEFQATRDVFGAHNPIRDLPNWLSGDAAGELLRFFQRIDPNSGALAHDFTDPNWDTRFLGDLYQDLSEEARKRYALLQTPVFVEEFILDRTLYPAIEEFGLARPGYEARLESDGRLHADDRFRMIDPACGSGHFLLGSFARLLERWRRKEPGTRVSVLVQRALDGVHGVDLNPYAIAIARFRLLLAALNECGITRLSDANGFEMHLACGDSLLHGSVRKVQKMFDVADELKHVYQPEDPQALSRLLQPGSYHAVVANPPYITPKDSALNSAYRERYETCHGLYSLAVPFLERIFRLAAENGYTGQITANSFMKRDFGQKLIEKFFPTIDLTHVVDTSGGGGAHIPGHKTGTVILFGRNRKPVASTIRAVRGIRGEPTTPVDPAKGLVWSAILSQIDCPGSLGEYVSVDDALRAAFLKHPWSIGGGGTAELKARLDQGAPKKLIGVVESIGFFQDTHADEAFVQPQGFAERRGCRDAFRNQVRGDNIRDWSALSEEQIFFPYSQHLEQWQEIPRTSAWTWLYNLRTELWTRTTSSGETYRESGRPWFDYHQFPKNRARRPLSIAFAFVATHNHFIMDTGGIVFNRSAPVIKLPLLASQDNHIALVGLLNSSTACFWMKQVFYPKATSSGDISTEKGRPEANRYEFAGTALQQCPVPFFLDSRDAISVSRIAAKLMSVAHELQRALPKAIIRNWTRSDFSGLRDVIDEGRRSHSVSFARMIALQEELDWEIYRLFGLTNEGSSEAILNDESEGIPSEARPFLWKGDVAPEAVPFNWRSTYEARRRLLGELGDLAIIENAVFKRPWWGRQGVYGRLARDYESWTTEALASCLLDRLESYFDFDGRMNDEGKPTARLPIALTTVGKLAEIARQDPDFLQVGELYRDDPAFDVARLVAELVVAESVPLLPILRYKPSGLRKREEWEKTWALQRQEDAIDARTNLPQNHPEHLTEPAAEALKKKQVGTIPVPPKYTSADFLKSDYWRLRGKLDVPKERWVSFPHCEGPDGTLAVAWAGSDHLQLARAISAYHVDVQERLGGRDDPRLVPLLACLIELLPWLKQWHNEVDPEFGVPMGDYFEGFIQEEARQLGKTVPEIKAWELQKATPRSTRGRKQKPWQGA